MASFFGMCYFLLPIFSIYKVSIYIEIPSFFLKGFLKSVELALYF